MELDGKPVSADSIRTLALYGYGHFTSLRVENGRVRGLSLHLQRLVHDSRILFGVEPDPQTVRTLLRQAAAVSASPTILRVTVFPPELDLGHPGGRLEPHVLVSTRPAAKGELPPLRLQSTRYQRELPEIKHVGLLATIYHRRLAQAAGFDDVLFLDSAERVSEGATWNIGFVNGDKVIWPQAAWLPGVTMRLVEGHAGKRGIRCITRAVHRSDLDGMRSAFITNAALGLRPVAAIDDITFEPASKLVKDLRDAYNGAAGEPI